MLALLRSNSKLLLLLISRSSEFYKVVRFLRDRTSKIRSVNELVRFSNCNDFDLRNLERGTSPSID